MQLDCDGCGRKVEHVEGPTGGGYMLVRFDDSKYWTCSEKCASTIINRLRGAFIMMHPDGAKSHEIPSSCFVEHNAQNRRAGGWSGD